MPPTKLSADDARDLARHYYDLAGTVGGFRFDHWDTLTKTQRIELESLEWSLLTQSSDMTTRAIMLASSDLKGSMKEISRAAKNINRAVKRVRDVKKVINLAGKAIDLGIAVFTGNAVVIAKAVSSAVSAAGVNVDGD